MFDVLVVDDDFMVARAHARLIEQTDDFRVVGIAHNGQDALRAIGRLRPHLVLLDIYLPDMTGLEVMRRSREVGSTADFLVLTAAREAETVGAALQGGTVGYLIKPFRIDELRSRLAHYRDRRNVLDTGERLDQAVVDRVFMPPPRRTSAPPKGISPETADLISSVLRERSTDVSASEAATLLGLSRVVARKYLEYFAETGLVKVRLRYGQAGRPQRRYVWADRDARGKDA